MFKALLVGVFLFLLYWTQRRNKKAAALTRRLESEIAETQRQLEKSQQRAYQLTSLLAELHEHKVTPTGKVSWKELAEFTVQTAAPLVGTDGVVLLRWDPTTSEYRGLAGRNLSPQQLADLKVRPGEGVLGRTAQRGTITLENEPNGTALSPMERFLSGPHLVIPLWVHSQVYGLFAFYRPQGGRIGPESMRLASLMVRHVQMTLENLDLYESRQRVYSEVVTSLLFALNAKDRTSPHHAGHCQRWIRAMAKEMHLPDLLTEQIEFGALLHDVGKLGIDQNILAKPGPLSEEEYKIVRGHPQIGYQILNGMDFFKAIAPMVLHHHEWINGQGYPEGLVGEEIPLGARMIAIADTWDRMTNDQPYRKALSQNNAIAELRQQAGTQFDPKLVDIFLHVLDQQERVQAHV